MATTNSGVKLPNRPAPGIPLNRRPPQKKAETNDWPPDPFSPPKLRNDSSKGTRKAPPRPPPPRINNNNGSNHFRSIFGSSKRNPKKGAATAIVKPMPPSSTSIIPTGTLIDLQTPPSSPKSQKYNTESIWSFSGSHKTSSTFESGFEDDFGSLLSSSATTPGTDLLSDLSPDKSETFEVQPLKNVVAVSAVTSRPTIICVPKAKPARPPPPQLDGSPPMPSMPPPPPPPDLLQVLTSGPELPPKPSIPYQPKDNFSSSCTALYDYDSTHPDDLSFRAGDVIHLIKKEGEEWLRGSLRGKEGIFPASYVSVEMSNQPLMTVIALFPFHADSWDDLELQEGDTVTVLDRVNKDWLYGDCCGRRGLFPECLVQDISYLTDED